MKYSLTHHRTYNRVYIYSVNKSVLLVTDIVVTGELVRKLELAIKQGVLK